MKIKGRIIEQLSDFVTWRPHIRAALKKSPKWVILIFLILGLFLFKAPASVHAKTRFVTIGTGGVTGVYYPTGGAIGRVVNMKRKQYDVRVTVESTAGSVYNVNAMMNGELEFGIVQSDVQYHAYKGLNGWSHDGPQTRLRAIFSLYPETVVLVAGDDTGIETFMDIKGAHVNIGNPGSGQRVNSEEAMKACGIDWDIELKIQSVKPDKHAKLLQGRKIHAFFYTVGHPNSSLREATSGKRKVHFVPIVGDCIDRLIETWAFYTKAYVPIKFYPLATNEEDVETFAVKATFCTSADVPDDIVYIMTKEVFENLERFKALHPAYEVINRENMLEALTAPIHPGALKYYKEVGLKP